MAFNVQPYLTPNGAFDLSKFAASGTPEADLYKNIKFTGSTSILGGGLTQFFEYGGKQYSINASGGGPAETLPGVFDAIAKDQAGSYTPSTPIAAPAIPIYMSPGVSSTVPMPTTPQKIVAVPATIPSPAAPTGSGYLNVQGAYFKQTPNGLSAVNDPATLAQLKTGAISSTPQSSLGTSQVSPNVATPVAPPISPTPTVPQASNLSTSAPPTLPNPSGSAVTSTINSSASSVDTVRAQLDAAYKQQLDSITAQKNAAQAKIDALTANENAALGNVQSLTQPFRQTLEDSERKRLQIEDNYFANQDLINQLQSLLTDGQNQINDAEHQTGLASILNPRIDKLKTDIAGQAGVIQAVLAARNNQISVGEGLIDRTANAIANDRTDQLNYYKALLDFYGNEKKTAQGTVTTLTSDQRKYLDAQVGLIQDDLKNAQTNADTIKSLLTDPQTALMAARAGLSLTDSPEVINQKLAKVAYSDEVTKLLNDAASKGYSRLLTQQDITKAGTNVVVMQDSQGRQYYFSKAPSTTSTSVQEIPVNGVMHKVLYDETSHSIIQDFGAVPNTSATTDAQAAARITPVTAAITKLKDPKTGYINPQAYQDLYNAYVTQNPGKGKEFLDNFPVSIYLDPKDRYLFSNSGT